MDNEKTDNYYLEKIKFDLKFVIDNTAGLSQEDIKRNDLLVDSIMFRVIQISENASKLSEGLRSSFPNVPWAAIKGMRNRIVHDYGSVSMAVVHDTVANRMPEMYLSLCAIET